jgi:hypothetical protein
MPGDPVIAGKAAAHSVSAYVGIEHARHGISKLRIGHQRLWNARPKETGTRRLLSRYGSASGDTVMHGAFISAALLVSATAAVALVPARASGPTRRIQTFSRTFDLKQFDTSAHSCGNIGKLLSLMLVAPQDVILLGADVADILDGGIALNVSGFRLPGASLDRWAMMICGG